MGRITIFTESTCPDSERAKTLLEKNGLPFIEINLTKTPERRGDMIRLCQEVTTPQIFFNEKHIRGGVQELEVLVGEFIDEVLNRFESHIEEMEQQSAEKRRASMTTTAGGAAAAGGAASPTNSNNNNNNTTATGKTIGGGTMMTAGGITTASSMSTMTATTTPAATAAAARLYGTGIGGPDESVVMSIDKSETTTSRLIALPDGTLMSPGQLTRFLMVNTPHKSVTIDNKTEYKFFRGYEGMMIWTNLFGLSTDEDSVAFGAMLQEHGILHNFTPRAEFQNAFLVLQPLKEPHVLNSFLEWRVPDPSTPAGAVAAAAAADPMDVMLNLSRLMDQITLLPAEDMKEHELYKQFEEAVCQLQVVSVNDIRTGEAKVTFGLNLFNLMIRHALIERESRQLHWPKRFKKELPEFLAGIFYNLGGDCISLRDLQCSLFGVDGNDDYYNNYYYSPAWWAALLGRRRKPCVKTDKRILFALSWGTKMSPEVWTFHPNNLDEELQLAAEDFCQTHIKFDEKHSTVVLPKLFKWYRHDFGSRNMRVVEDLVKYLSVPQLTTLVRMSQRGPVKVKFEKHDWTCTLDVDSITRAADGKRQRSIRTASTLAVGGPGGGGGGAGGLDEDDRSPNDPAAAGGPEQAVGDNGGVVVGDGSSPRVKRSFLPSALVGGRLSFHKDGRKKGDHAQEEQYGGGGGRSSSQSRNRFSSGGGGDYNNFSMRGGFGSGFGSGGGGGGGADDDSSFFQSVVSDVTYGSEFKDIIAAGDLHHHHHHGPEY